MPSTAPSEAVSVLVLLWKTESRKTAVSKPSRKTARKAISTRARAEPGPARSRRRPSRSFLRWRAFLRIQKIIQVTMPTAIRPMTVSSCSC